MAKYEYTVEFHTSKVLSQEAGAEFWKFAKEFVRLAGDAYRAEQGPGWRLESYVENYDDLSEAVQHIENTVGFIVHRFDNGAAHITALSIREVA